MGGVRHLGTKKSAEIQVNRQKNKLQVNNCDLQLIPFLYFALNIVQTRRLQKTCDIPLYNLYCRLLNWEYRVQKQMCHSPKIMLGLSFMDLEQITQQMALGLFQTTHLMSCNLLMQLKNMLTSMYFVYSQYTIIYSGVSQQRCKKPAHFPPDKGDAGKGNKQRFLGLKMK